MRSQRACELLAHEGYSDLVNLDGGFHGARDPMGGVAPGWATEGFEQATQAEAGKSWDELSGGA